MFVTVDGRLYWTDYFSFWNMPNQTYDIATTMPRWEISGSTNPTSLGTPLPALTTFNVYNSGPFRGLFLDHYIRFKLPDRIVGLDLVYYQPESTTTVVVANDDGPDEYTFTVAPEPGTTQPAIRGLRLFSTSGQYYGPYTYLTLHNGSIPPLVVQIIAYMPPSGP
jgi:hypothetical protein